jgi:hypothetical protein
MAAIYPIPESLNQNWKGVQDWLQKTLGDYAPGLLMPKTPKDAYESGIPGMGVMPAYVPLPERMGIMRSSPFFQDMLNGPGPKSSNIKQLITELNQGQNYTKSLRSLADMLGVDKSKLMQLFGTNAGR